MARESLPRLACACASLRRTARVVTQLYETELQGTGLRVTQFTLLQALEQMGGAATQGALGRLLALDATTLSRAPAGSGPPRDGTAARCVGALRPPGGAGSRARFPPGHEPKSDCAPGCPPNSGRCCSRISPPSPPRRGDAAPQHTTSFRKLTLQLEARF